MSHLADALRDLIDDAEAHGHRSIDTTTLRRVLGTHREYDRLDLLAGDQFERR